MTNEDMKEKLGFLYKQLDYILWYIGNIDSKLGLNLCTNPAVNELKEKINVYLRRQGNIYLKSKELRKNINEFMFVFSSKFEQNQYLSDLKTHLQRCMEFLNNIIGLQEQNMHTAHSNDVSLYKKDDRINEIGEKIYNINSFPDDPYPSKASEHNFKIEYKKSNSSDRGSFMSASSSNKGDFMSVSNSKIKEDKKSNSSYSSYKGGFMSVSNRNIKEDKKSHEKEEYVDNISSLGKHYIGSDNNTIKDIKEYTKADKKEEEDNKQSNSSYKGGFMSKSSSYQGGFMSVSNSKIKEEIKEEMKEEMNKKQETLYNIMQSVLQDVESLEPDKEVESFKRDIGIYLYRKGDLYAKNKKLRKSIIQFIQYINQKNYFEPNLKMKLNSGVNILNNIINVPMDIQTIHSNNIFYVNKKEGNKFNEIEKDIYGMGRSGYRDAISYAENKDENNTEYDIDSLESLNPIVRAHILSERDKKIKKEIGQQEDEKEEEDKKSNSSYQGGFMSKSNSDIEEDEKEEEVYPKLVKNKNKKNNSKNSVDYTTTKSQTGKGERNSQDVNFNNIVIRKTSKYENLKKEGQQNDIFLYKKPQNNNESANCVCGSECCITF